MDSNIIIVIVIVIIIVIVISIVIVIVIIIIIIIVILLLLLLFIFIVYGVHRKAKGLWMSSCSNPIGYPKIKQKSTSVLEPKGQDFGTQPFSCSQASRRLLGGN